jgi:hypothetical protein
MIKLIATVTASFLSMLTLVYSALWYSRCLEIGDEVRFRLCSLDVLAHSIFYGFLFSFLVAIVALIRRINATMAFLMVVLVSTLYTALLLFFLTSTSNSSVFSGLIDPQLYIVVSWFALQIFFNWFVDRPRTSL